MHSIQFEVEEVDLVFETNNWDKVVISDSIILIKPRFMVSRVDWRNICDITEKQMPYVIVKFKDGQISSLCAYPGLVRELPIFYSVNNSRVLVSDSPENISGSKINPLSVQEFLVFGYVTSNRTLFENTYSLQAGEKLVYDGMYVKVETEYLYNSQRDFLTEPNETMNLLSIISESIFHDLISELNGKTALVPLSAGYDSRFIVSMLKLGGFENVICYAWGIPGSKDVEISKKIATKLGYRWEYIEHSDHAWELILNSVWFSQVLKDATKFTSISGAASFPFQQYLRSYDIDLDNCVVIPGHTGDFISGGHIPLRITESADEDDIVAYIKLKHFLPAAQFKEQPIVAELNRQVSDLFASMNGWRALETWEWRERQAKFIVNTNRYYESLGLAWSMPFWHYSFTYFWERVLLKDKKGSSLYNLFLEQNIFSSLGVDFHLKSTSKPNTETWMRRLSFLKKFSVLRQFRRKHIRVKDEFGFYKVLGQIYESSQKTAPFGYEKMQEYAKIWKVPEPNNHFDYLSASVLAALLEDLTFETTL